MIPRFKKVEKPVDLSLSQEQFLEEHNRLSPENLRATSSLLCRFRAEKTALFEDDNWPIDKIRKPFISWLIALALEREHKNI